MSEMTREERVRVLFNAKLNFKPDTETYSASGMQNFYEILSYVVRNSPYDPYDWANEIANSANLTEFQIRRFFASVTEEQADIIVRLVAETEKSLKSDTVTVLAFRSEEDLANWNLKHSREFGIAETCERLKFLFDCYKNSGSIGYPITTFMHTQSRLHIEAFDDAHCFLGGTIKDRQEKGLYYYEESGAFLFTTEKAVS